MTGSSLQDQLLKLGLAQKKPAGKKRGGRRKEPGEKRSGSAESISLARAYSERSRLESREKAHAARRKREEDARKRKANAMLAELMPPNALSDPLAEHPRYFQHAGKIRKLFVSAEQQQGLNEGALGIVSFKGRYHILDAELIGRVRLVKPEALVFFAPDVPDDESQA